MISTFHSLLEDEVLKDKDDDYLYKTHKTIVENIRYMSTTIDDFQNFFSPEKKRASFSLKKLFADIKSILGNALQGIEVSFHGDLSIELDTIENELKQALINILVNAKDALNTKCPDEKKIEIEARLMTDKKSVQIIISNNGGNIPDDIMPLIFKPFYTTKGTKGTGFGLYLVSMIINDSLKGSITAKNIKDGVSFEIVLPVSNSEI